jgi:hypothetical protein
MAVNLGVYNIRGAGKAAYKNPQVKAAATKENRYDDIMRYRRKQEEKLMRTNIDNFVYSKLEDLPEDYSAEKIPTPWQNALQTGLMGNRMQYADASRRIANLKASGQTGSPEYMQYTSIMSNAKNSLEGYNTKLKELQELTEEYVSNRRNVSKGMDANKIAALDEVFVNKNYNGVINNDGSFTYQTEFGDLDHSEISKYFLKDSTVGLEVLKQAQGMYSKGVKGLDLSKDDSAFRLMRAQLSNLIDQRGPETIKSLLNDDLFDGFKLIDIPDEIANDPARQDEVQDMILDGIMSHISTVNADGLKQYKAAQVAKSGSSSGVPGYKMGQGLKDDLFTFGGLADKGMRGAQNLVSEVSGLLSETRIPEGERQVLFAQKVPEYRQKVVNLIKDQMSPSERGKLQTREEVFDLFKNSEDVVSRKFNPDQLREAFINTYGDAGIFYDNDPFNIDITDAYAVSNAFFDLADISTDAKNYYKNQLEGMRRSGEATQQQRATADDLIAKYSN